MPVKLSTTFIACAAAFLLTACGGSGGDGSSAPQPDPLASYKNQPVNWSDCSRYIDADTLTPAAAQHVAKLGDRLQCADIKAPLDYQNPDGLQITVSMLRVKAAEASETKPNLFFNPGGPGGDGQMNSLSFSLLLSNGNPDSTLGRKYKEVSQAYNFVGFSPRGVGASTNIVCLGNELVYPTDDTKWGNEPENIRRLTDIARYTASNCQKNPLSDYINTDATARDMDLMRHLLGDEKFHYYGISYGTWLGFWYAGIFPDKVGPMVLDSNMNFSKSIHDASISYAKGQIHTFKEYVAAYAARHDGILGMGTAAQSIVDDLNDIDREVAQALLDTGGSFRAEPRVIPGYLASIKAAIETQKRLDQGNSLWDIEAAFMRGDPSQGDPYFDDAQLSQILKTQAGRLIQRLQMAGAPGLYDEPEPFALDTEQAVWNTVVCNDEPLQNKDQVYWVDTGFELAGTLPIVSNSVATQPCLYWDWKSDVTKPSVQDLKDAPLLMVQSEFDVPTPLVGAMETFEQLPAARMVRIQNEGAHGLLVYQTECVDLAVMDHLLGTSPSQRLTECQGKPLPLDARQNVLMKARASGAQAASNFEDPEMAETLLDSLRKAVDRESF